MKKALQAFAIVAPVFVASAVPSTSHEVNDPYQAINEAYSDLKATANTLEFWESIAAMRELTKISRLQGPLRRFTLIMNTIDKGFYDHDINAQKQLSICATHDIGHIANIINLGDYGLKALHEVASDYLYHIEQTTRDFQTRHNCTHVLNSYALK